MYDYAVNAFWWVYVGNFSEWVKYPETPPLDHLNIIHSWWYNLKLGVPEIFLILKNFPFLYFYRTFSKRLWRKLKSWWRDHFKYVVLLTSEDLYLSFSLSEKAERRCIFEIIHSGVDTGDHIVGWIVWENLPQWVGNYSDWLMSNKDQTKKLFGVRILSGCSAKGGKRMSIKRRLVMQKELLRVHS